jgi:hypothetical protein
MANVEDPTESALPDDEINVSPVYRAIDSLATVKIEVQLLRRRLQRGESPDDVDFDEVLQRIEPQLEVLSDILSSLRDTKPL